MHGLYCNHSVMAMACCMLKAKNLSGYLWGEAITTTVHILNRSPMRTLDGHTPF